MGRRTLMVLDRASDEGRAVLLEGAEGERATNGNEKLGRAAGEGQEACHTRHPISFSYRLCQ